MTKKVVAGVNFEQVNQDWLKEKAEKEDRSVSYIINRLIESERIRATQSDPIAA